MQIHMAEPIAHKFAGGAVRILFVFLGQRIYWDIIGPYWIADFLMT